MNEIILNKVEKAFQTFLLHIDSMKFDLLSIISRKFNGKFPGIIYNFISLVSEINKKYQISIIVRKIIFLNFP